MITDKKLNAVFNFLMNQNSTNDFDRITANGKARAENVLTLQGQLKPEYQELVNVITNLVNDGQEPEVVLKAARETFNEPAPTAQEEYDRIKHGMY